MISTKVSLRRQLLVLAAVSLVLIVSLALMTRLTTENRNSASALQANADTIALAMIPALKLLLPNDDQDAVRTLVQSVAAHIRVCHISVNSETTNIDVKARHDCLQTAIPHWFLSITGGLQTLHQYPAAVGSQQFTLSLELSNVTDKELLWETMSRFVVMISVLIVVFVSLYAWLLKRRFEPLLRLGNVASQVRQGDLSIRAPSTEVEEISDVSVEFNRMLDQLNSNTQQLESAVASATEASKAKSEFLATMSHELRTPLNAVIGFAQLLKIDASVPDKAKLSVEKIENAGAHLLLLIEDLMDLSRIEAGKLRLVIVDASINEAIEKAMQLLKALATEHGITIVYEESADVIVRADPARLVQVLVNLISNAIKYNTEDGSVTLRCTQRGGKLRVAITDTGDGITAEDLEKLFKPFERLVNAKDIQGVGLGLFITRRLIEEMAGTFEIDSQPGEGSTASVELNISAAS